MSDVTTGVAASAPPVAPAVVPEQPAAPVVPAAPAVPEATPEAPLSQGKGKMGARTRVQERAERIQKQAAQAEAARQKALGQMRVPAGTPEGGEFAAPKDTGTEPAQDPAASQAAAADAASTEATPGASGTAEAPASPAPSASPKPEGAQAPAGMVDVPLPEGHPLRDRGRTFIRVAQEFEADVRNGINSTMKLKDAEAERDRLAKDNALLEARRQALSGDLPNPERDPSLKVLLEQVRGAKWGDKSGDQMAEILTAAFQARERLAVLEAESTASIQHEEAQTAGRVLDEITTQAGSVFQIWQQAGELWRVPQLVKQYYAAVDARNTRDGVNRAPTRNEFFEWAKPAYRADPRVQTAIDAMKRQDADAERERIRKEVQAEHERKQQEAAAQAAERRAGIPPTSRALPPQQSTTPAPAPTKSEPQRHGSHRNAARSRVAEIAARHMRTP